MRTIEVTVTVEQGQLIINTPISVSDDITDGQHQALIVIDEAPEKPQPLILPTPRSWGNWPPDSTFSREDLYDDDGR